MVYERPTATAAERHAIWRDLEQRYLPWRDYGDLAYAAKGGSLAMDPAHLTWCRSISSTMHWPNASPMQLWMKSETDRIGTFDSYAKLCASGGSAPFLELVREAGLVSPFADGALSASVAAAEQELRAIGLV